MRVVCFVEARMRSSWLAGKALLPILRRPIFELMVERLRRARTIDDVLLVRRIA